MRIILKNFERDEIILWLLCATIPDRLASVNSIKAFKQRANKFFYSTEKNLLFFKQGPDSFLRFFTLEEELFKTDFIKLQHVNMGHAGRDRLYNFIKTKAYGILKKDVSDMISECEICQSHRSLVTRPIIRPIIAKHPRERYIVDLIDFRYYSEVNDGFKWMLVMVDSFSKFMWTVPLIDKSASTVVPAIKTIFMTYGQSFLLHSDNGKEFCNSSMRDMLETFNVRHVRGRARCPWIQGQVERANQTIKWMIGSKLLSLNTPGKWSQVREDVTHAYNNMRHSTTANTPFICMFGPPIRELMQEDLINSIIDSEISNNEDTEEVSNEGLPMDNLHPDNINAFVPEEIEPEGENQENASVDRLINSSTDIRDAARVATQRAADRMVARSMWRNDYVEFQIGARVLVRPDIDSNQQTRSMPLFEHLDTKVYIVAEILQFNKVKLTPEDGTGEEIAYIDILRLRRVGI